MKKEEKRRKEKKKKAKDTSTPRRKKTKEATIPALSFVAGNIDKSFIDSLCEKLGQMDAKIDAIDRRWKESDSRTSDRQPEKEKTDSMNNGTYHMREDIQLLSHVSDAQKELLDMGIVVKDTGIQYQTPVPGLRPVNDFSEFRHLKPHPGVTEKQVKQILQGEYCELPILLQPEIETVKESNYEAVIQDGQFLCKVKEAKREINSIVSWMEAWAIYENIMLEYHGMPVYRQLYNYKMRVMEWYKKYSWASIYKWDVEVRQAKGSKSMNFLEQDAGLFAHHFDHTTHKPKPKPKCQHCNRDEHKGSPCPFRREPGTGNSTGQRRDGMGQYKYNAARPDACYFFNTSSCFNRYCNRPHICKNCAGPMPHFECRNSGRCAAPRYF